MKQARLYDTPEQFAGMMMRHLSEALKARACQAEDEPLLLKVSFIGKDEGESRISLHNAYQTYINTGDLNQAIDHLNGIISSTNACQSEKTMMEIDLSCIYPALRDTRYVEEAGREMKFITEQSIPGLNIVYLELKRGFSKIINYPLLNNHHKLTEERVKRIAYRNLRSEGWTSPSMSLPSPSRKSCVFDVYIDNPFPIECQFLNHDLSKANTPDNYLIAFTNRATTLAMRSTEKMDTAKLALHLAKQAQFNEIVRRSYLVMPHSVSDHIYWSNNGKFQLL